MKHSETFIKNSLVLLKDHIIFCGSYALLAQKMITRDNSDFDVIMSKDKFAIINFQWLELVEWCYQSSSAPSAGIDVIYTCRFKDNSKIDFIIRTDVNELKVKECNGIFGVTKMLEPMSIVREKMNLIDKDHNKNKHMHDIINVMQNMLPDDSKYTMADMQNIGKPILSK